jgi:hypothetical protein
VTDERKILSHTETDYIYKDLRKGLIKARFYNHQRGMVMLSTFAFHFTYFYYQILRVNIYQMLFNFLQLTIMIRNFNFNTPNYIPIFILFEGVFLLCVSQTSVK